MRPRDIHRQIVEVYGDNVMDESFVRLWYRNFNSGRKNVHDDDDERTGRPSVITDDLLCSVLQQFQWEEIFDHPPYSPDLAPSDFHLLQK